MQSELHYHRLKSCDYHQISCWMQAFYAIRSSHLGKWYEKDSPVQDNWGCVQVMTTFLSGTRLTTGVSEAHNAVICTVTKAAHSVDLAPPTRTHSNTTHNINRTSTYKLWLKTNEMFSHTLPRGQHCHSAGSCWSQQDGVLSCLPGTELWLSCQCLSLQQAIQAPSTLRSTPHAPASMPLDGWRRNLIQLWHWTTADTFYNSNSAIQFALRSSTGQSNI
jgi:hypothetical protein